MACDWNSNNLSCTNTWGALLTLEQLKTKFSQSGSTKMPQLAFWVITGSINARQIAAGQLASDMDGLFMSPLVGAKREAGVTRSIAIQTLKSALLVATKTVCDLSITVDELYLFQG